MLPLIGYILPVFFVFSAKTYHPVHVSILNVDYNTAKPSTVEMSLKIFTGDLEMAIAHQYNIALHLGQPNEVSTSAVQIQKYLEATLMLKINNMVSGQIQLRSKENDGDATRLYFSFPVKGKIKQMTVNDMVLMDVFDDQTNLVIVVINGKERGYRQSYGSSQISVQL